MLYNRPPASRRCMAVQKKTGRRVLCTVCLSLTAASSFNRFIAIYCRQCIHADLTWCNYHTLASCHRTNMRKRTSSKSINNRTCFCVLVAIFVKTSEGRSGSQRLMSWKWSSGSYCDMCNSYVGVVYTRQSILRHAPGNIMTNHNDHCSSSWLCCASTIAQHGTPFRRAQPRGHGDMCVCA